MRDIVSEIGTFYGGLTALPTISASQYSPAISAGVIADYDGLMAYILCGTVTGSGSMTPALQVTNDDGAGNPVANNWTNIPAAELVAFAATSASDPTPVRLGNQQPNAILIANEWNQRVGWMGFDQTFTANSSPGDGLSHPVQWFRVASVVAGSWSAPYDVVVVLGRPRNMPASV